MTITFSGGIVATGEIKTGPTPLILAPEITVNAVNFDGTNDYLTKAGGLSASDSADALISFWFNILGNDGATINFLGDIGNKVQMFRKSDNKFDILLRTSAPANLWSFEIDALYTSTNNTGWNHFLLAAQFDGTPVGQIYLNDAPAAITEVTSPTTGSINWGTISDWGCGGRTGGTLKHHGDLAEVYATNEYLDISVTANRRKFISAGGKPVDLETNGSGPTGTQPIIYLTNPTSTWQVNKGSGGGFTENGALTTASTSPSD